MAKDVTSSRMGCEGGPSVAICFGLEGRRVWSLFILDVFKRLQHPPSYRQIPRILRIKILLNQGDFVFFHWFPSLFSQRVLFVKSFGPMCVQGVGNQGKNKESRLIKRLVKSWVSTLAGPSSALPKALKQRACFIDCTTVYIKKQMVTWPHTQAII